MSNSIRKHDRFVGVDLGGTNVRAGLVQNGKITALNTRPISSQAAQGIVIDEICETIAAVLHPKSLGIGIGVPSLAHNGVVFSPNNIPSWKKVPLQKILQRRFGLPVFVDNDANCFALGELHYGKGRRRKNLVGVILGTGLGSGVIINGKLYSGHNGGAGEIGNATYRDKNFEYYCSGRVFSREYGLNGYELQQHAEAGNRKAQAAFAALANDLAEVIKTILYAYDPEMIVLGGSVSKALPFFEKQLWKKLETFRFQSSLKRLKIVQSEKANIAILAAAALCLDKQ